MFDHDLFLLSWGPTVAALSYVFDNAEERGIVQKAITGFRCVCVGGGQKAITGFRCVWGGGAEGYHWVQVCVCGGGGRRLSLGSGVVA